MARMTASEKDRELVRRALNRGIVLDEHGARTLRRPDIQDILNPESAGPDARLTFVRLDDRGDLGVYVWGAMTCADACEWAMEHAAAEGWQVDEEDVDCFAVQADDRKIVLLRSLAGGV